MKTFEDRQKAFEAWLISPKGVDEGFSAFLAGYNLAKKEKKSKKEKISLRDYFAGQVLLALAMRADKDKVMTCKTAANMAFNQADEMIAEREKR